MAWIFEKSPLWRSIVARTRESPVFYAGFGVACFAVPYALGKVVMWGTNPDVDPVREELLRRRQTVHNQVMAKANRERLAVLLGEIQERQPGDQRYAAALNGESYGTHSTGTTTGARTIQELRRQRQTEQEGRQR